MDISAPFVASHVPSGLLATSNRKSELGGHYLYSAYRPVFQDEELIWKRASAHLVSIP